MTGRRGKDAHGLRVGGCRVSLGAIVLWVLAVVLGTTLVLELGHFFTARLLRRQVTAVEIGSGPALFSVPWFGARLILRAGPGSGRTRVAPGPPLSRPRATALYLSGSLANVAVGAPLTMLAAEHHANFLTLAGIWNLIAVLNLVPLPVELTQRPNDGLQLWRTWFPRPTWPRLEATIPIR